MTRRVSVPALVFLLSGGVLLSLLTLSVRNQQRTGQRFIDHVLSNASRVDRSLLLSGETAIGAGSADDRVVALRLGDALVRWQVGRRIALSKAESQDLAEQLEMWLTEVDLRGSGERWAQQLLAGAQPQNAGSYIPIAEPDETALRSLRRSLPDGVLEAGRWLGGLKLLSSAGDVELSLAQRKAAFAVLDGADLLRANLFHGTGRRLPELLTKAQLTAVERVELGALAGELVLIQP